MKNMLKSDFYKSKKIIKKSFKEKIKKWNKKIKTISRR